QLVRSDMPMRPLSYFVYDDTYWGIVSMQRLPAGFTYTSMLNHMLRTPHLYWLVLDFRHNPHNAMLRDLTTRARRYQAAANDTTLSDYADASTRTGFHETDAALMESNATGSHFFDLGVSMI